MLNFKTIIHPTDFSEHAEHAYKLACALAHDHGARLLVAHVHASTPILYGEGMLVPPDDNHRAELKRKLAHIADPGNGVVVERHLLDGDPVPTLLKFAQEQEASLIVMGTHGWTGLNRLLLGSVAEQLVRKAHCPVVTVKYPAAAAESAGQGSVKQAAATDS